MEASKKKSLAFFLVLLIIAFIMFYKLTHFFIVPVIISLSFTTLLYPIYEYVLKFCKNKASLASILTILAIIIIALMPLYLIGDLLTRQIIHLYSDAEPFIREFIKQTEKSQISALIHLERFNFLKELSFDFASLLRTVVQSLINLSKNIINFMSQSALQFFTNLGITLFCMFYFFRDGKKFGQYILKISPMKNVHMIRLFDKFSQISRATIKGTLVIGLIQGTLGAITLLVFGVKTWALWGMVMVVLATVPFLGTWLILVPAGVIKIIMGHPIQGIFIIAISVIIVSSIDNIIRPILVGKDAKMHDLLIFFSTLGGIALFGLFGFIIGPIFAAFLVSLLDIYCQEYKNIGSQTSQ
ncbi:MAG: AI-2E family transporter [Candidatus Cloacimonetes bacterium]|nr:AI-2E family transporter [Candidatus Cloacimonadota bacterium]